jgi:succinate dehydrogenase assembly factor 1
MAPRVHSGIQKQVLTLYRTCLRTARRFEEPSRREAAEFIRTEFRDKAKGVDRLDFQRIEHLIRAATKKLKSVSAADVSGFSLSK